MAVLLIVKVRTIEWELRAISCQAEKLPERKDAHRKPLLPRVADAAICCLFLIYGDQIINECRTSDQHKSCFIYRNFKVTVQ